MSMYARIKSVYRLLPESARDAIVKHTPGPLQALRYRAVARLERSASPDELYDDHYYDAGVDPLMLSSADAIARSIQAEFAPRSAIDVGCGTGALMAALERLGVKCLGLDYAAAAVERCERRGLRVRRFDIEHDGVPSERADVAVSTEVAEHLPEASADLVVELLTTLAPLVVFTAALPGSGGKDHVNEQPNVYWIRKFDARGFTYHRDLSMRLRGEWRSAAVDEIFCRSLMVFERVTDDPPDNLTAVGHPPTRAALRMPVR
jgi:SAM-dependent methyltransferase